jgi:hypothetical protein
MEKITQFRDVEGKPVSSIIDAADFLKMIEHMINKNGYKLLVHSNNMSELSVSDDDTLYKINFSIPTIIFKGDIAKADIDKLLSDDISAMMIMFVKGDTLSELNRS